MSAELASFQDDDALPVPEELQGAWAVLKRGIGESTELRRGLGMTVVVSLGVTVVSLVTPVLIQKVFDHGLDPFDATLHVHDLRDRVRARDHRVRRGADRRAPARGRGRERDDAATRAHVLAHPRALDRRPVRGEAWRVRRPRDRRHRRAPTVHGVGRDRVDHLADAGHRRARPDALLRVAAGARDLHPDRAAPADRLVDAGEADGRVQHGAHPGRRDAVRGLGVGDGRGRRARLRARRAHRPEGQASDRPALPGRGDGPLPCRDAVAAVVGLLRAVAVDGRRARRVLRAESGACRSARSRRSCSWPTCSCTCSPTCRRSTRRRRTRSRPGARSWRSTTWRSRSSSRSTASSCRAGRCRSRPTTSTSPTGRGRRCCTGSRCPCPRAATSRSSARRAVARAPS